MTYQCHICGVSTGTNYPVREMMFGTRELFNYWECAACGCVQLTDPPSDLARYYPHDKYCSFRGTQANIDCGVPQRGWLRRWLWKKRNAAICFGQRGPFSLLARWMPNPMATQFRPWFQHGRVQSFDARIVDVGCGEGTTLRELAKLGFNDLLGVDPFLPEKSMFGAVRLVRCSMSDLVGKTFELIMLHHSLEHMPNQHDVFQVIRKVIASTGSCLIRIPLASAGPWKRYGTDWVELDAPRHFFLHTERSLQRLATAHGLQVDHIDYEAEPFAYAVSELYRHGESFFDAQAGKYRDWRQSFSALECAEFERLAFADQQSGHAGRAAFFLSLRSAH